MIWNNLNNVRFAYPWMLVLIPLSLFAVELARRRRPPKETSILFPWLSLLPLSPLNQIRVWLRRIALILLFVGWCAWIVAAARPQRFDDITKAQVLGIDIMVVLDTSSSMLFEDFQPNRFDVALKTVEKFVRARTFDRIGLVVFGGESFTLCPLTLDHDILIHALRQAKTDMTRVEGTAIGTGLANAVARLKDSTARSRVIVLMTDGVNNMGNIDPLTAGQLAAGYGIKVYTVGIGREGLVPAPIIGTDLFGRQMKSYQQVQSTVDYPLLDKIAEMTQGRSFKAGETDALPKVFDTIDKLERTSIEGLKQARVTELFPSPLQLGTWLLAVSQILLGTFLKVYP